MDRIAVLIPCYNEELTIGKVIRDWREQFPEAAIYVYDNNSEDGTVREAVEAGAILRRERHQGKGNVVRRMFREIDAECYILVDGDDTYPAESGREMSKLVLENSADMVIGDRLSATYFSENKRKFHNFGNSLVRTTINHLFHVNIRDIMTGYRAFSYLFVKSFPILSEGFEIETEMTIHAVDKNMSVANVVVPYRDRPKGSQSKLNTCSDGLRVLKTIFRLYKNYRPMEFFGSLSAFLILFSGGLFLPIFIKFLRIGSVPNFPTLIVSGFIALTAVVSWFAGMILSSIVQKDRQAYEFRLHLIEQLKRIQSSGERSKS